MMHGFKNPVRKHQETPKSLGIDFEEVSIRTLNNKSLYGWWIEKDFSYPVIILVHGWGRNVGRMLPYIQQFNQQQYNLLVFDSRNHGHSDYDKNSTMKKFAEDIKSAVDFLRERYNPHKLKVGIVGLSIGGAAAIYAAAHDARIKSMVTVGAFAHPLDIMKIQLHKRHIPYYPIGYILLTYMQLVIGFKFRDIAPENHIGKSESDILLIHGMEDKTVPYSHAERLKNKSSGNGTKLWLMKGKGHSDCHFEQDYWQRLFQSFNDSFNKP